jgi:hypothetical protein
LSLGIVENENEERDDNLATLPASRLLPFLIGWRIFGCRAQSTATEVILQVFDTPPQSLLDCFLGTLAFEGRQMAQIGISEFTFGSLRADAGKLCRTECRACSPKSATRRRAKMGRKDSRNHPEWGPRRWLLQDTPKPNAFLGEASVLEVDWQLQVPPHKRFAGVE